MKTWWHAPVFSPRGFLVRAALIALAYAVMHLCGCRQYAGFLSGTPVGGWTATLAGFVYVLLHFAFVLLAPILILAAGLQALALRWLS